MTAAHAPTRTAIVFGGSGFLGHAVVQALAARGYNVRVPTRDLGKTLDLKPMGVTGQVTAFTASVRSDSAVALAIEGCDVVINLIGTLSEKRKSGYQTAHVETAARLARLAREAGVRHFIHVSALGIDPRARETYVQTKARGEEAIRTFFPPAVILRPGLMFGPRDRFFNRLSLMARYSPILPLFGNGHARLQPVYVGDVAAAIMAAIDNPSAQGGVFDVAGAKTYTLRELMALVMKTTGRHRLLVPMPNILARALVGVLSLLPAPPLTSDQLGLMNRDNISRVGSILPVWGIKPKTLEEILPTYLC